MNYYIFTIKDRIDGKGRKRSGVGIFKSLIDKNVWGIKGGVKFRDKIRAGDKIIFYLAGEYEFLGSATIVSNAYLDNNGESEKWFGEPGMYRIDLKEASAWQRSKPVKPLIKSLKFIKNKAHWGTHFQGGIVNISKDDYEAIISFDFLKIGAEETISPGDFINQIDFSALQYEPQMLESPARIKVSKMLENVDSGVWQIPNFQRYFDWLREDIRSFLESVFNEYYVGSFLLWEVETTPPLETIPLKGVVSNNEPRGPTHLILDGQQRMTALYYAVKAPEFSLRRSTRPCYFYIDFKLFRLHKQRRRSCGCERSKAIPGRVF